MRLGASKKMDFCKMKTIFFSFLCLGSKIVNSSQSPDWRLDLWSVQLKVVMMTWAVGLCCSSRVMMDLLIASLINSLLSCPFYLVEWPRRERPAIMQCFLFFAFTTKGKISRSLSIAPYGLGLTSCSGEQVYNSSNPANHTFLGIDIKWHNLIAA